MDFVFYNTISIRGFTTALNIIDATTRKLWTFTTSDKRPPLRQINFFLSYLKKINKPCHEIRVDEGGELAKSSEFTDILVHATVNLQTTGGYSSWLNGKIERSHQTVTNMLRAAIKDTNHDENKWCFALEASCETYNNIRHSMTKEQPHYSWYGTRTSIHDLRVWGCEISPQAHRPQKLSDRVQRGYFMGYTNSRAVIKWWDPNTDKILLCTGAKFNEYCFNSPNGKTDPGCLLQSKQRILRKDLPTLTIDVSQHPIYDSPPKAYIIKLPPKSQSSAFGIKIMYSHYYNMSYITQSISHQLFWNQLPPDMRHNVWILSIGSNEPISKEQVIKDLHSNQHQHTSNDVTIILAKRKEVNKSNLEKNRALFHQIRFIKHQSPNEDEQTPCDLPIPIANRIINLPNKPATPEHIGQVIHSPLCAEWTDAIFENYEKMATSNTFSKPFLRSLLPKDTTILHPRLAFKVKITELPTQYDLYCRMAADGSKQKEGIDFTESYSPVASHMSIRIVICYASANRWTGYVINISNAFQTNFISNVNHRHYMGLPYLFLLWYTNKWPNDPICKEDPSDLVLQTQKTIQGTKDAGKLWYDLIRLVFEDLGMIRSTCDHGIFTWNYKGDDTLATNQTINHKAIICLATDDILIFTNNIICYQRIRMSFDPLFDYSYQQGPLLKFLNMRIIQSNHGISIDQTNHIQKNILQDYWKNQDTTSIKWQSAPFPTESSFEEALFHALPLTPSQHKGYIQTHNGSLAKWIGALMHITQVTRFDINYACMRLSTYMSNPNSPSYDALHQLMTYLLHHKHLPIMYPTKPLKMKPIHCHFRKGHAEYSRTPIDNTDFTAYHDADLARDLRDRKSVNSSIHEMNGVAIDWICKKQHTVAEHSNGSEIRALFNGVRKTFCIRNFMTSIGSPICLPTPTYEDNQATIKQVNKDRLTPRARPVDVLITSLHEHKLRGTYEIADCHTDLMLADFNSKPLKGNELANKVFWAEGVRFLPPSTSTHFKQLELHKFPVGIIHNK